MPYSSRREPSIYYVADGDSRTADDGPTTTLNWFNLLCQQADHIGIVGKNYARAGKNLVQIISGYSATGAPSLSVSGGHQWSPAVTGRRAAYFLWALTNNSTSDAATNLARLQTLYTSARADGYYPIVGFTEIPRLISDGAGWSADAEAMRLSVNASLRGLTLGAAGAPDILIDTARLLPNYDSGYFDADQLHLSASGQRLVAKVVRAAINQMAHPAPPSVDMNGAASTITVTAGSHQVIKPMEVQDDPYGLANLADGTVLCPYSGRVQVSACFLHQNAAAGDAFSVDVYLTRGGTREQWKRMAWDTAGNGSGTYDEMTGSASFPVQAGDILDWQVNGEAGTLNWPVFGQPFFSSYSVEYTRVDW